jgi:hypothetical protein
VNSNAAVGSPPVAGDEPRRISTLGTSRTSQGVSVRLTASSVNRCHPKRALRRAQRRTRPPELVACLEAANTQPNHYRKASLPMTTTQQITNRRSSGDAAKHS